MRRVLLIAQHVGPNGGAGAHVEASAQAMTAAGFDVHVVAGSGEGVDLLPGVADDRVSHDVLAQLDVLLHDWRPEVIHLHAVHDDAVAEVARRHGPVIWSAHNYAGCTTGEHYFRSGQPCTRAHGPGCVLNIVGRGCAHRYDPRGLGRMYRRATRALRGFRASDAAIVYSNWMVNHLITNGVLRVEKIPLFVDVPDTLAPLPRDFRVGFFGRLVGGKGLDVAIRAMRQVDAHLEVYGKGWAESAARRLVQRLRITDRVHFHGWASQAELAAAYAGVSAVTVPSRWPEPFGLVGIEAMAFGRPTVGSRIGGIPEWLRDGETGRLVPPGDPDALAQVLNEWRTQPDIARRLGIRAHQSVGEQFTAQLHVEALRSCYRRAYAHWEENR